MSLTDSTAPCTAAACDGCAGGFHDVVRAFGASTWSRRFAYGQTSSGKTFTLFGPEGDPNLFDTGAVPASAGVIPRAVRDVFAHIEKRAQHTNFTVYCSFLQVCGEPCACVCAGEAWNLTARRCCCRRFADLQRAHL